MCLPPKGTLLTFKTISHLIFFTTKTPTRSGWANCSKYVERAGPVTCTVRSTCATRQVIFDSSCSGIMRRAQGPGDMFHTEQQKLGPQVCSYFRLSRVGAVEDRSQRSENSCQERSVGTVATESDIHETRYAGEGSCRTTETSK